MKRRALDRFSTEKRLEAPGLGTILPVSRLGMRKGLLYGIIVQMKRHFRIVVGAAVGLTLTPAPLPALSRGAQPLAAPLILAQAQLPEEEELLLRKKGKGAKRDEQRTPRAERPAQR
ncbi:MAG: hypothetical protein E5V57_14420, partial [Mesorhizobium sp.]